MRLQVRWLLVALAASLLLSGCGREDSPGDVQPEAAPPTGGAKRFETTIVASRELGTLRTRVGQEAFAGVMCATCHSMEVDKAPAEWPTDLQDFHTGMTFAHGALSCNSCHNPDDRSTLRAANGKPVAFEDTMELCGQCHGPQMRDYRRGAHGGAKGYWDLNQGPRVRNNCVNCHDPHEPRYPRMMPEPPPRDRFFGTSAPKKSG